MQGVLHNPKNDKRTTAGVFHVADGGLPVSHDKKCVPKVRVMCISTFLHASLGFLAAYMCILGENAQGNPHLENAQGSPHLKKTSKDIRTSTVLHNSRT